MGAFIVIGCCVLFVVAVAMAASGAKGGSGAGRPGDEKRLLALEFRGVVVGNERVAHAFDAKYSCHVKIKCDDGANVTVTTSVFDEYKFPVGVRVVKRVGQRMPEPDTGPAQPPRAPAERPDPSA